MRRVLVCLRDKPLRMYLRLARVLHIQRKEEKQAKLGLETTTRQLYDVPQVVSATKRDVFNREQARTTLVETLERIPRTAKQIF